MSRSLSPCPAEVQVERLIAKADHIIFIVHAVRQVVPCPGCARPSRRIHSHYERRLADLPWNGIPLEIRLRTRRFFCDADECDRRIFTERLPETTAIYARRTLRMEQALRWLGLALGGEAGARTAERLGLGVSGDTLLRHLRRMALAQKQAPVAPRVLGMDDWAWRKGQRYGTILCDLERRRVVDLLPDRQSNTVAEWLRDHAPSPEIISRDRAGAYAEAAHQGAPQAVQVADRFSTHASGPGFDTRSTTQPGAATETFRTLPASDRVVSTWPLRTGHRIATRTEPEDRALLVARGTIS